MNKISLVMILCIVYIARSEVDFRKVFNYGKSRDGYERFALVVIKGDRIKFISSHVYLPTCKFYDEDGFESAWWIFTWDSYDMEGRISLDRDTKSISEVKYETIKCNVYIRPEWK